MAAFRGMRGSLKQFFAFMACCLLCTTAAGAIDFRHGDWLGEEDWEQEVCRVAKQINPGVFFFAQQNWEGEFWIGLQWTGQQLPGGRELTGSVTFDKDPPLPLKGAGQNQTILFQTGNGGTLRESFARKGRLRLSYDNVHATITLRGSTQAAAWLGACVERVWPGAGDEEDSEVSVVIGDELTRWTSITTAGVRLPVPEFITRGEVTAMFPADKDHGSVYHFDQGIMRYFHVPKRDSPFAYVSSLASLKKITFRLDRPAIGAVSGFEVSEDRRIYYGICKTFEERFVCLDFSYQDKFRSIMDDVVENVVKSFH